MPYLVLSRDRTIPTLSGHIIKFKKDDPTYVPPPAVAECMGKGASPFEGEEVPESSDDNEIPQPPSESIDPTARRAAIVEAIGTLVARNTRGDFDASGKPHPKAISQLVGFTVDARERNTVWTELQEAAQ